MRGMGLFAGQIRLIDQPRMLGPMHRANLAAPIWEAHCQSWASTTCDAWGGSRTHAACGTHAGLALDPACRAAPMQVLHAACALDSSRVQKVLQTGLMCCMLHAAHVLGPVPHITSSTNQTGRTHHMELQHQSNDHQQHCGRIRGLCRSDF